MQEQIGWSNESKLLKYILNQLKRLTGLIYNQTSSAFTGADVPANEADPIFNAWLVANPPFTGADVPANEADPIFNAWLVATPPLFSGDNIDWGAVISTNTTYKGETLDVTVDTNSIGFGGLLAQASDFHFDEADASAMANCNMIVMALEAGTGTKKVLLKGQICNTAWNWVNGPIYVSETLGGLTQSLPMAEDAVIAVVGWALSGDTIYFNPYNAWATTYLVTTTTTTTSA